MVKTKKINKSDDSIFRYLNLFYNLNTFTSIGSKLKLGIFNLVFLFILLIINLIRIDYLSNYVNISISIITIIIGVPIFLLGFYGLFYIFLNAYDENKRKSFFESFLVFSAICLPFFVIGHSIVLLINLTLDISFMTGILNLFLYIFFIYFLTFLVILFKRYYKISAFQIISSIILVNLVVLVLVLLQYLNSIISLM